MMKMRFLFQTLIYCIIFISHCDYGKSLADKETSTPPIVVNSVELENEMAPLKKLLNKLEETKCEKEKQLIKGRFFGRLEKELEEKIKKTKEVNQLLEDRGSLKHYKDDITDRALKNFAVSYLCRYLELYEEVWDCGGNNSPNFNPNDTENTEVQRHDLDAKTHSNYRSHAKKWDRIFQSSKHPLVINFKTKISKLFPQLSLSIIAKNLGLTHALLNNAKHGAMNDDPTLKALLNPDSLVSALKKWDALNDPVLLDIVKTFEQVIRGL